MSYYYFASSNPCICTPSVNNPDCPDDCNCLKVCNIAINALSDDAVGPCAATGTEDLSDTVKYPHDFCACGADPVVWAVVSYDEDVFVNVSINRTSGVLTWITQGAEAVGEYGCVIICVSCGDLKVYARLDIGVEDLCAGCTGNCDDCDPCTGIIAAGSVDSSIEGSVNAADTNITGS